VNERDQWIALASVTGVGEETWDDLIARFGTATRVFQAVRNGRFDAWFEKRRIELGRVPIIKDTLSNLRAAAVDPAERLAAITAFRLWTYTALDTDYPARLRELTNPPVVLHGAGSKDLLLGRRLVAVVGTRRPTPGGRALTAKICARLVECGATVVSGLAVGIDGAAHAATLEHNGTTVGVIGGGHKFPGPRAHQRLRDEVLASGGAIISEHHPESRPAKGTFPRRNRIIAALADAVIVVEAPSHSGALNTAHHALGLGRPVFVAPGRIGDWATAGCLKLLRDTPARPIVGLDELIEDLGYFAAATAPAPAAAGPSTPDAALAMLGQTEQTVARRLIEGAAGLDLLVAETNLSAAVVSSAITFLLMRGWAVSVGPAFMAAGPLGQ
jgi:DNA processing protein